MIEGLSMPNYHVDHLLFFVTSKKHIENIELLRPFLRTDKIGIVTDVPSLLSDKVVFLDSYRILEKLRPSTIVMFMAYPVEQRLWLIEYSLRNDIPCVGIEEGNQLCLNNGRVNHYFSPLDGMAAASDNEKRRLQSIPVPYWNNIVVTGWGFFQKPDHQRQELAKSALLFLSPLRAIDVVSLETEEVRLKLLTLAQQFTELGYSVSVKPHPMEPREILQMQLESLELKHIKIMEDSNVAELISQHEVIINRGNSQVCLEAVYQDKKVLIYPLGVKTIFDDCSNVLFDKAHLEEKLQFLSTEHYLNQIAKIKTAHIPYAGEAALQNIVDFISSACQLRISDEKKALQLSLLYFICGRKEKGRQLVTFFPKAQSDTISKFYKMPYSSKRFVRASRIFQNDVLERLYLTKIYIDNVARLRGLRHFFVSDRKWMEFPHKEFIPHFWDDSRASFGKVYKQHT